MYIWPRAYVLVLTVMHILDFFAVKCDAGYEKD